MSHASSATTARAGASPTVASPARVGAALQTTSSSANPSHDLPLADAWEDWDSADAVLLADVPGGAAHGAAAGAAAASSGAVDVNASADGAARGAADAARHSAALRSAIGLSSLGMGATGLWDVHAAGGDADPPPPPDRRAELLAEAAALEARHRRDGGATELADAVAAGVLLPPPAAETMAVVNVILHVVNVLMTLALTLLVLWFAHSFLSQCFR